MAELNGRVRWLFGVVTTCILGVAAFGGGLYIQSLAQSVNDLKVYVATNATGIVTNGTAVKVLEAQFVSWQAERAEDWAEQKETNKLMLDKLSLVLQRLPPNETARMPVTSPYRP